MNPATKVPDLPGYAELHCLSSFSFLRSASQPEELAARALRFRLSGRGPASGAPAVS